MNGGSVTVVPDRFVLVDFDAALIASVAREWVARLGLDDVAVVVRVDESTVLARVDVQVGEGIEVRAGSGAFEDTRRLRRQSEEVTRFALARALLRARDRLRGGFALAPPDADLTHAQRSAWSCSLAGRLSRLDLAVPERRWRYDFRNRHGFTDAADRAFDRIWASDALEWAELVALSDSASARCRSA